MTNLFKKTLVAAAITACTTSAAFAATIEADGEARVSNQGVGLAETLTTPGFTITLEREYSEDDIILVNLSGATFGDNSPTLTIRDEEGNVTTDLVLGQLGGDEDTLEYRVTNLGEAVETTVGYTLSFTGLELPTSGLSGDVSVSFLGETDTGRQIETGAAEELAELVDQFSIEGVTSELDAVIDVETSRQTFEGGATTDSFSLEFGEITGLNLAATAATITHTLYGDFSYADDTDAEFGAAGDGDGDDTYTVSLADDFTSATIVQSVVGSIDNPTVTLTIPGLGDGNPSLAAQSFSADVELGYELGGESDSVVLVTGADVGAWSLNGAQVFVPFVANGNGVTPFFRLTNNGMQDAEIEVEVFTRSGRAYNGGVIEGLVLEGNGMVRVTMTDIERAVGASLFLEDVAITFTVNAPAEDITVVAGYNARGDRVIIPTESLND